MFWRSCLVVCCCLFAINGCGAGGKNVEQIEVDGADDPLQQPRMILERYAGGQALGSEVTSFAYMVETVRKTDPASAEVLEKGLADLQSAAATERPAKAKELLTKLKSTAK